MGSKKHSWSQNLKSLAQKTKIWHNNAVSKRFGKYSFYWVSSNFKWKIFSNVVAFSEYPNFTTVRFFEFLHYRRRSSIVEKKTESQFSFMTLFKTVNQSVIDGVKCVGKKRPHRHLLLFSIFLMVFTGMNHSGNTQLYVEKVFGWTLPEYTNYIRFVIFFFITRI